MLLSGFAGTGNVLDCSGMWRAIFLTVLLCSCVQAAEPDWVWWEGENTSSTNFPKQTGLNPSTKEADVLSNQRWLSITGKRGPNEPEAYAEYTIDVPKTADYQLWTRKFWKHGPFKWHFDKADWQTCGRDVALADSVTIRPNIVANWVFLGKVHLDAGKHTFELRLLAEAGEDKVCAFDAFLLTPTPFFPAGKLKPGELSGLKEEGRFSYEPPADSFSADAMLDLRSMNEPVAGQNGRVRREGDRFVLGNGQAVRFFGVNVSSENTAGDHDSVDYLARRLAKLGVNAVRFHSPIYSANDISQLDPKKLDDVFYLVSALKKQGIYTTLSVYFPLWVKCDAKSGLEGYDAIANKNPFGLIFFNPNLQALHKGWLTQLMTTKNPYTSVTLAEDPAVMIVELVNEDSLFFHTFNKRTIPPVQWSMLEEKYAAWLKNNNVNAPATLVEAWWMTRDGVKKTRPDMAVLQRQVRFLAELQRDWFKQSIDGLKAMGYTGLVDCGNWKTADAVTLEPVERWTYHAGDVIDRHGYFGGNHEGDAASYSVRVGQTFSDASALKQPQAFPVWMVQEAGYPSIISELGYPQPNRFRSEFAPVCSAFASAQGIDGLFLFAMGSNFVRDTSMVKFQLASPAISCTFPASALMYRRGDIAPLPEKIIDGSDDAVFSLKDTGISEGQALDQLRKDPAGTDDASTIVGQRFVRGSGATPAIGDHTPELTLDTSKGVLKIDTPRTVGLIGFVQSSKPINLRVASIIPYNEYASILITALDDQPLETSHKILLQYMTDDRPYGFAQEGRRISNVGSFPFTVANMDAMVTIPHRKATQLDANGNPVAQLAITASGAIRMPHDAMYVVFEK